MVLSGLSNSTSLIVAADRDRKSSLIAFDIDKLSPRYVHKESGAAVTTDSTCTDPRDLSRSSTMPKPKRLDAAVHQETLTPPDHLPPTHSIARLTQAAGKNLYHLALPSGSRILAELPARFRSTIWLKRGSYVLVDTGALADRENKLSGEIVNVVGDEKAWRRMSYWPGEFGPNTRRYGDEDGSEDEGPQMPPSDDDSEED
nr:s1-like domain-containing protein [Quercus suber]